MAVNLSSNVAALSTLLTAKAATSSSAGSAARQPTPSSLVEASVAPSITAASTPGLRAADERDQASAVVDSASAAGVSISDTLVQIRRAVTAAASPSVTAPQRDALTSGFQALLAQLHAAVSSASFGGVNLLDGSSEPAGLTYSTRGDDAARITLHGADLRPGGSVITFSSSTDLSTAAAAEAALTDVNVSTSATQGALARLDAQAQRLTGASSVDVTDADGAALLALQVRQQLSSTPNALTVSSQSILNLFKG